jgi:hypothetical protein
MTPPPLGIERRIGQRFSYNLPVSVRDLSDGAEGLGFTQDLSSRGAFFFTDMPLGEGAEIELTLKMPGEVTLGESMRVRCRGQVLRVVKSAPVPEKIWKNNEEKHEDSSFGENENSPSEVRPAETKIGVAVCLVGYEYLSQEDDGPSEFRRISALHQPALH